MRFPQPLIPGLLIKREKRFLVHVELQGGRRVIAHTNNTGSMMGCNTAGSRVWLSPADNPKRKLAYTFEIIEAGAPAVLVGINTLMPNRLLGEALAAGSIPQLADYDWWRSEAKAGVGTRFDFLLGRGSREAPRERAWVEVKNVTLVQEGRALFPDAVSERGRKHLAVLSALRREGERALMVYVVQRADAASFGPADAIDPRYGEALREAVAVGVEVLVLRAEVSPVAITLGASLPFTAA